MNNLIYPLSELGWMTGIIAVGVVFAIFAVVWDTGPAD